MNKQSIHTSRMRLLYIVATAAISTFTVSACGDSNFSELNSEWLAAEDSLIYHVQQFQLEHADLADSFEMLRAGYAPAEGDSASEARETLQNTINSQLREHEQAIASIQQTLDEARALRSDQMARATPEEVNEAMKRAHADYTAAIELLESLHKEQAGLRSSLQQLQSESSGDGLGVVADTGREL